MRRRCYTIAELKKVLQEAGRGHHTSFYAIAPDLLDPAFRWLGLDIIHLGKERHSVIYHYYDGQQSEPQTINADAVEKAAEELLEEAKNVRQ